MLDGRKLKYKDSTTIDMVSSSNFNTVNEFPRCLPLPILKVGHPLFQLLPSCDFTSLWLLSSAWAAYRSFVSQTIADEDEHTARIERRYQVYDHYLQLVGDYRLSSDITVFPEGCNFVGLPAIIPLWKPVDADTSEQALTKAYPIFRQALLQYQVDVRIKAIRTIIAANREVKVSSLSKDASFYPETIYDSAFFALATSQFVYWENHSVRVSAFPEIVQGETRRSTDSLRTDLQQVRVIRSMVVQARLDTSNATWQDLAQLGKCFVWINSPFKGKRRKVLYDCVGLVRPFSLLTSSSHC